MDLALDTVELECRGTLSYTESSLNLLIPQLGDQQIHLF